MRWIEATIKTASGEIDELCATLETLGVEGVRIEDETDFQTFLKNNRQYWDYVDEELTSYYSGLSRVKFYLPDDEAGREALEAARRALGKEITVAYVDDADWENNWKENFPALEIGERLLVVPEWVEPAEKDRVVLRLEPGLGFGTGSHATTRMCLNALEAMDISGKKVLDLGCGSGILGIAALTLGARSAKACDVDPKASDAARHNAALNGITEEQYQAFAGDILTNKGLRNRLGKDYDIVLANIVTDVILALSGHIRDFLRPEGSLICSGIIDGREAEVEAALQKTNLKITRRLQEDEWHCFVAEAL